jgi:antitoxin component YwqK of YwqJK toxin-antitoxin module
MKTTREVRELRDAQGRLLARAEYLAGDLDGLNEVWNAEGTLVQRSHYKSGVLDGAYEAWWDNGTKKEVGTFHNGERIGRFIWFAEDGSIHSEHQFPTDP